MRFERFQIRKVAVQGHADALLSNHKTAEKAREVFTRKVKRHPTAFIFDADRGARIPTRVRGSSRCAA